MNIRFLSVLIITSIFLAGFLTSEAISTTTGMTIREITTGSGIERLSPADRIKEDQIRVYDDKVILNIEGVEWARFTNTNSMDPFLDEGANALQIIPQNEDEIKIGDIISYNPTTKTENNKESPGQETTKGTRIIHRVIYKSKDEKGTYFIVKGDNNKVADPGKIRFEQIDRILIGILY